LTAPRGRRTLPPMVLASRYTSRPIPDTSLARLFRDAAEAHGDELLQFVQARVSPHKRLRALRFVDAIPKSASGKILRRVLVAQDRAGSPG
jgi:acyl-CoA synthetase (AMP-forming)/AMP-acid ligase II